LNKPQFTGQDSNTSFYPVDAGVVGFFLTQRAPRKQPRTQRRPGNKTPTDLSKNPQPEHGCGFFCEGKNLTHAPLKGEGKNG
jgi:hypothetical protein